MDAPNGLPADSAVDSEMDSGGVRPALQADSAPDSAVAIRFPIPDSADSGTESAGGGERVTLQEAAGRLGVGITTARRWVRNGRLKAIQEETPQGHMWRVLLPAAAPEAAPDAAESTESVVEPGPESGPGLSLIHI